MNCDYVMFHAKSLNPYRPCIDGLFAAYAASLALPQASLVPAIYQAENAPKLRLKQGDRIFLLDLTYPAFVLEGWADQGVEVIVLDHHKGAMDDLSGLSDRILTTFDMKKSGAVLAWEYFHPGVPVPEIFRYVQDRDIWTKKLPGCDLVHLGLLESLEELPLHQAIALIPSLTVPLLRSLGEAIEVEVKAAIAHAIASYQTRIVMGHTVPFYKCSTKREFQCYSDIGHALMQVKLKSWVFGKRDRVPPFAVIQTGGGWALRSNIHSLDVCEIAKKLGGGGHRDASGCKAELPAWLVP